MALNTEVCNLAISHLGVAKTIIDVETEQSIEAKICRRFYELALKAVLRDYPWPFATKISSIALVENNPNDDWEFSSRYPSDCLHVRRILGQAANVTIDVRVPYKISRDGSGRLIYTNQPDAQIEYTLDISDYTIITGDFILAFSFLLAHYAAPALTNGDPFKLGDRAKLNYYEEISSAKATAVNEEQVEALPESEYVRGRL